MSKDQYQAILKQVRIHFYTSAAGMLFFLAALYFVLRDKEPVTAAVNNRNILLALVTLAVVILFLIARYLFQRRLNKLKNGLPTLLDKLQAYREAQAKYLGTVEATIFFPAVAFMLTRENLFLAILALGFLFFFLKFPHDSRIFNDLQLDTSEQLELTS